ncbi:hypothetical protein B7P34_13490 [Streptosporangium nondiastaticum]|uniref:Uncharacterized protein n=1 Tax=Streptosporangium nondiastaticum TaxID=35764 RepID=A0A9X7PHP1_9ACTN|nr:hypothetical protein B7P34_13490 [Streptosporangium nondiastaticum]
MTVAKVSQKCGARTKAGKRYQRAVSPGTSRCWEHPGEWTDRGQINRKLKELKETQAQLNKSRKR